MGSWDGVLGMHYSPKPLYVIDYHTQPRRLGISALRREVESTLGEGYKVRAIVNSFAAWLEVWPADEDTRLDTVGGPPYEHDE